MYGNILLTYMYSIQDIYYQYLREKSEILETQNSLLLLKGYKINVIWYCIFTILLLKMFQTETPDHLSENRTNNTPKAKEEALKLTTTIS